MPAPPPIWLVLESGAGDATWNMALDEALLESLPRLGQPVLRFYGWTEPAASFGYFQHITAIERWTSLRPLVRRPTAGGVVPHDADWTYGLAFPTTHPWYALTAVQSYQRVHLWIQAAFARLELPTTLAPSTNKAQPGQCFAGHERFDLLWQGRKIAGAAQRRRRDGLLIQGSVQPPRHGPPASLTRQHWERAMLAAAAVSEGVAWTPFKPDEALTLRARELAALKYSTTDFNRKR